MTTKPRTMVTVALLESEDADDLMTVFVQPDTAHGWTAQCIRHTPGGSVTLGRVFHHANASVVLGKMLQWIERRYGPMEIVPDAQLLSGARGAASSRIQSFIGMEPPEIRPLGTD